MRRSGEISKFGYPTSIRLDFPFPSFRLSEAAGRTHGEISKPDSSGVLPGSHTTAEIPRAEEVISIASRNGYGCTESLSTPSPRFMSAPSTLYFFKMKCVAVERTFS